MGKFVEEKKVIETYLDNYVNTTADFSRFIEGSPNFVTYYSKDLDSSTRDVTLNGVYENIGIESPIKFHKIENFPLYNMEEFTPDNGYDEESGYSSEIESTAIILPNTIKPLTNDVIHINYMGKPYLYRISNVETNNVNNTVFYKVSFYYVSDNIEILNDYQVSEEFKVVYENLGKKAKSVIRKTDFLALEHMDNASDLLVEIYKEFYYIDCYNTFIYNEELYDNMLMGFIEKNNLFIKSKSFLSNIKVEQILKPSVRQRLSYKSTIFEALQNKNIKYLSDFYYTPDSIYQTRTIFDLYKNKYSIKNLYYGEEQIDNEELFCILPNRIVSEIKYERFNDTTRPFYYIMRYLNDRLSSEVLVEYINSTNFKPSLENYVLLPCLLFILRELSNEILNK